MAKSTKTNGHDVASNPTDRLIHTKPHQRTGKRQQGHVTAQRKLALVTSRESATEAFNEIVRKITSDLGGESELSEISKRLILSFTGATILQSHQLQQILNGEKIDVHEYSSVTTAMIRSAMRLGTGRKQKQVNPLDQYLQGRRPGGRKRVHVDVSDVEAAE